MNATSEALASSWKLCTDRIFWKYRVVGDFFAGLCACFSLNMPQGTPRFADLAMAAAAPARAGFSNFFRSFRLF